MPIDIRQLPDSIAAAVHAARASIGRVQALPIDTTPMPEAFTQWAKEILTNGELDQAIREASASDPDLAD